MTLKMKKSEDLDCGAEMCERGRRQTSFNCQKKKRKQYRRQRRKEGENKELMIQEKEGKEGKDEN